MYNNNNNYTLTEIRSLVLSHVREARDEIELFHVTENQSMHPLTVNDELSSNVEIKSKLQQALASGDASIVRASAHKMLASSGVELSGDAYNLFCRELICLHAQLIDHHNKVLQGEYGSFNYLEKVNTDTSQYGASCGDKKAIPRKKTPNISEAVDEYVQYRMSDKDIEFSLAGEKDFRSRVALFVYSVGDINVGTLTVAHIKKFNNVLQKIPHRFQTLNKYKDIKVGELLKMELDEGSGLSGKTRKDYFTSVNRFLSWCANDNRKYLEKNPADNSEFTIKVQASKSYQQFNNDEMVKLLCNDGFSKTYNEAWQFWVPLISAYSGMRQNEICQLMLKDVFEEDGVYVFSVNDDAPQQKVKNNNANRLVPIHSVLIDVGILRYIDELKAMGEVMLFPSLKFSKIKGYGQDVSRWFNGEKKTKSRPGLVNALKIKQPVNGGKKSFHSLRSTANSKALSAGAVEPFIVHKFMGHDVSKSVSASAAPYTQASIQQLKQAVESIAYDIDHTPIRDQWKRFN